MHTAQEINHRYQRHAHACRATVFLTSWRCGEMPPMTGGLEWKDIGSLEKTSRGDQEGMLPTKSVGL